MARGDDLDQLYGLFAELAERVGGMRRLRDCTGYMDWPDRDVYFFFTDDERRERSDQRRLTRVGTHAVSAGSGTSLWNRLRTHRGPTSGTYEGGGNHRGSVFRKRVGEATIERDGIHDGYPHWGEGYTADRDRRLDEYALERRVSSFVRNLPFLWIDVDDEPGPESDRAFIERNMIALVSNYESEPIDPRDDDWLGNVSPCEEIRDSGLWNVDHVGKQYDPIFLDRLDTAVRDTTPP